MPTPGLDTELAALGAMNGRALRERWTAFTGKPPPKVSPALLRLALAWEMQASVHGGLSPQTERRLAWLSANSTRTAKPRPKQQLRQQPTQQPTQQPKQQPTQQLVREWKGTLHTVTIEADDTIRWNGKTWRSLSEVARAITGTRWSGPAFFGLKQKSKAA